MIEKRLITRLELAQRLRVKPGTIAKWERTWFPKPADRSGDRLIYYAVDEVEAALAKRSSRQIMRRPPRNA